MLRPLAGMALAVNVACWPTWGGVGSTVIDVVGAAMLETAKTCCVVAVAPAASRTLSVTVWLPTEVKLCVTIRPVLVTPFGKVQVNVHDVPQAVPSSVEPDASKVTSSLRPGADGVAVNADVGAVVFDVPSSAICRDRVVASALLAVTGVANTSIVLPTVPAGGAVTTTVARPSLPVVTSDCDSVPPVDPTVTR